MNKICKVAVYLTALDTHSYMNAKKCQVYDTERERVKDMQSYNVNGAVIEILLDSGKTVKVMTKWVENTMAKLETDMEDVLLMWLEDNGYLVNEEQEELDNEAKGKVKVSAKKPTTAKQKTQKERVQKENPTKELIIKTLAESLEKLDVSNVNIENKAKIITFSFNNEDYKIDLVQKRKPKA